MDGQLINRCTLNPWQNPSFQRHPRIGMGSVLSHRMELLKSRPLQGCIIYYIAAEPQNLLYSSGPTESIFNEVFPLQVQRIGLRIDTGLFWSHLADPSALGKGKCHSPGRLIHPPTLFSAANAQHGGAVAPTMRTWRTTTRHGTHLDRHDPPPDRHRQARRQACARRRQVG